MFASPPLHLRFRSLPLVICALCACISSAEAQTYDFITIAGRAGTDGTADGTNGSVQFNNPNGIVLDSSSNLYVADFVSHTIRKLTLVGTNWVSTTISGRAGYPGSTDGTNSDALFYQPWGLAADTGGNLYVADSGNRTIRKLTRIGTNWVSSTLAGRVGSQGTTDGTNSGVRFGTPSSVAVDTATNIYVTDWNNQTIRKLTPVDTNWVSSTISGRAGYPGSTDGTNNDARFNFPIAIAVDNGGNLYVADHLNFTIRELTPLGTNWVSSTIAGLAGRSGSADGTNSGARFAYDLGVAVDPSTNIYVAEGGTSGNNTIRRLMPVGTNWVSSTIGGRPGYVGATDGTNSAARFNGPSGLVVDNAGSVYVTDSNNNTVREGIPLASPPLLPVFQSVFQTNGSIIMIWSSIVGRTYQIQYKSDLFSTNWSDLGGGITATNETTSTSDVLGADWQRYYRAVLLP